MTGWYTYLCVTPVFCHGTGHFRWGRCWYSGHSHRVHCRSDSSGSDVTRQASWPHQLRETNKSHVSQQHIRTDKRNHAPEGSRFRSSWFTITLLIGKLTPSAYRTRFTGGHSHTYKRGTVICDKHAPRYSALKGQKCLERQNFRHPMNTSA